ncbi:MAG: hypothetical protein J7L91_02695 [Candidatus Korarchaeota archaeon]|nr:hypothetical protein [Candidatus Korarchaeota archaeon]
MLTMRGWHPLIIDVKGEDETLHLPAKGDQARSLRAHGLEPRAWKVKYLTPNFPLGMEAIPITFDLASLSMKMLSYGHFRSIEGFLSPSEARDLFDAYFRAGGPDAKLDDIMTYLLRRRGDGGSSRLLALMTSGLFSDDSILEPRNLVDVIANHDFTIFSTAYFKPSSRDLARFVLSVVLDNLMSHLVQSVEDVRLVVHFRELREVAPRTGAMGSQWHLRNRIENFVTFLRQTKTALTRVFYEVQNVKSIPKTLLDNTQAVFVHPFNLKEEEQRKELGRYFPIPDSVVHAIAPLRKAVPGKWIFLSKSGYASWVTSPPPLSLRIPEPRSPEEAKRISQLINELVPRRRLREEFNAARKRYKHWLARARYIREEFEGEEFAELQEELPPPETLILNHIPRKFALFMKSFEMAPLDGKEKFVFDLTQPGHWVRKRWGERAQTYVISSALRAMLRSKNNVIQLKIAGFRFFEDTEGNLLGELDVARYRAHMRANGHKYDRLVEKFE